MSQDSASETDKWAGRGLAAIPEIRASGAVAPSRIFALDVLRGLAIFLVLVRHFPPSEIKVIGALEVATQWVMSVGWIGVDLFFVLSGFLISTLIYKEFDRTGSFDARRFWFRRGLKIWPAYFVAYGGMTLARLAWAFVSGDSNKVTGLTKSAICNALFLQNYLPCKRWSHSWSLAVEEHFYSAFALLVAFVCWHGAKRYGKTEGRKFFQFLVPLFFGSALIALLLRFIAVSSDYGSGAFIAYYQSHLRADALFFGVFLGYMLRYRKFSDNHVALTLPFVALSLALAFIWPSLWPKGGDPRLETLGLTLIYLSFGSIVVAAALRPQFGRLLPILGPAVFRPLAWLGIYSYTVYLAHAVLFGFPGVETLRQWLLFHSMENFGATPTLWLDRTAFLTLSVVGGVMLSHLIERPFLNLRERVLPTRRIGSLTS